MISDEHILALKLSRISREETLSKKPSNVSFEEYWLQQAIEIIERQRAKWERDAIEARRNKKKLKHP